MSGVLQEEKPKGGREKGRKEGRKEGRGGVGECNRAGRRQCRCAMRCKVVCAALQAVCGKLFAKGRGCILQLPLHMFSEFSGLGGRVLGYIAAIRFKMTTKRRAVDQIDKFLSNPGSLKATLLLSYRTVYW